MAEVLLADRNVEALQSDPSCSVEGFNADKVEVKTYPGEGRGRALFARQCCAIGEVVWKAAPLAAVQHYYSELVCPCCRQCFKAVHGVRQSLELALKLHGKTLAKHFPGAEELASELDEELREREEAPAAPEGPLKCPHGCGAWFCGQRCLHEALARSSHRVLCAELDASKRRLVQDFWRYCRVNHENLWLGLLVYGEIICCVRQGMDLSCAMANFNFLSGSPQWQDMVDFETDDAYKLARIEHYRDIRNKLLCESLSKVTEILSHHLADFSPIFEPDYWASLVGQFERVNMGLVVTHPLAKGIKKILEERPRPEPLLAALRSACAAARRTRAGLRKHDRELMTFPYYESGYPDSEESEEEGEDWVLPGVEGTCLLRPTALTNHSCAPNVRVEFPEGTWLAVARALRPLEPGGEVLQSYLDEDMDREWRRKRLLLDYGFACHCTRCEEEKALHAGEEICSEVAVEDA